jgi:hypothetical protein
VKVSWAADTREPFPCKQHYCNCAAVLPSVQALKDYQLALDCSPTNEQILAKVRALKQQQRKEAKAQQKQQVCWPGRGSMQSEVSNSRCCVCMFCVYGLPCVAKGPVLEDLLRCEWPKAVTVQGWRTLNYDWFYSCFRPPCQRWQTATRWPVTKRSARTLTILPCFCCLLLLLPPPVLCRRCWQRAASCVPGQPRHAWPCSLGQRPQQGTAG